MDVARLSDAAALSHRCHVRHPVLRLRCSAGRGLVLSFDRESGRGRRWPWTYPIIFSTVDPHVLFVGSQHLWKTTNGGQDWTRISPDLTRHDPKTMGPSGGPITRDMNGPEVYAVIFSVGPSKKDANVIWTG